MESTWGGIETITAAYEIKSTNILIINEDGTCRFAPNGFDKRLTQTIVLAFRAKRCFFNDESLVCSVIL